MRVAAVEALPDTDAALLAAIARDDESPRVRRAAIGRLADPEVLGAIVTGDADTQVRSEAAARLLALATEPDDEARALRALASLVEERHVAQVARTAPHLTVALAALERLRDTRAIGSTARNAIHEAVRLAALARVDDRTELEAIATNTEHKDVGLAALERLADPSTLAAIAERARNKVVGRRARAIVREQELREAQQRESAEARARRQTLLTEAVESLDRLRDVERGRAELERLSAEFAATGEAPSELVARFDAARERAARHFDEVERQEAEAAAARKAREMAIESRRRIIAEIEAADGPDALARVAALRDEWAALPPLDGPEADTLNGELTAACDRAAARVAARERTDAAREELTRLAAEAEQLAGSDDMQAARPRWREIASRWAELGAGLPADDELAIRFGQAEAGWTAREEAARAERARAVEEQRARLQETIARATALLDRPDATIRELDQAVRDLRAATDLPGTHEGHAAAAAQARSLLGRLVPRLRELREAEDWRRWANAGIQEELVKRVEALRTATDIPDAARQLRDLRRQWKAVSAGPREETEALWQRFKAAADEVQARCDEHFGRVAAEQAANLARRQQITEAAEALAQSTDWINTAETLKRLQMEWNNAGPAPREALADLARRFRTACDTFFTRRKADLAERKQVWAVNAQKKEALCARAEALAESTDWQAALNEIKQLQAEWKAVGPVRKNRSETLWKRFRGACDRFFERYGKRHEIAQLQRVQERGAILTEFEALAAASTGETAPDGLLQQVEEVWTRWHGLPGLPPDQLQPLRARFDTALEQLLARYPDVFKGSRFDVAAATARREALCEEVESVLKGTAKPAEIGATPAATLAALLKESLAANTIGGRVNEEAKLRAAADKVRRAQQQWRELGPVLSEAGRALEARFHKACRRFFDQHPELRHVPARHGHGHHARPGPRPR
ncbi:MAG TPA: DUF349 domain-containing protein [Vicinamibacterales bacterium]